MLQQEVIVYKERRRRWEDDQGEVEIHPRYVILIVIVIDHDMIVTILRSKQEPCLLKGGDDVNFKKDNDTSFG